MLENYKTESYHEPNNISSNDSLEIVHTGYFINKQLWITQPYPHYSVGLVLDGNGEFKNTKGQIQKFDMPFCYYFGPNDKINYGPTKPSGWNEIFIALRGKKVSDWIKYGWWPDQNEAFLLNINSDLLRIHKDILELMKQPTRDNLDLAKIKTEEFILKLFQTREQANPNNSFRREIESHILKWRENPTQNVDLKKSALEMGISYSLFRKQFKKEFSVSPYQFLLQIRIDFACDLLLKTNLPIKIIAVDSGFKRIDVFNHAFKKTTRHSTGRISR